MESIDLAEAVDGHISELKELLEKAEEESLHAEYAEVKSLARNIEKEARALQGRLYGYEG